MPNIPQSPLQDGPAVTDADLAALLAGNWDVPPGLQPVAEVLAALSTEPSPGELAGEALVLAEFRLRTGMPAPRPHTRRGTAGLTPRLGAKLAAGAAASALVLGGAATAAFAGMLPAPIQRFAHDVIGAPGAPAPQPGRTRGTPSAPGQLASHGNRKASAKPHITGRPANRRDYGQRGTGQGRPGHGEGREGNGQGQQGNGQGQRGSGQGEPGAGHHGQPGASHQGQPGGHPGQPGAGQGGQSGGQGNGQADPHAIGRYGDPHLPGQQGDPHPQATPKTHHVRPARHGPPMDT